MKKRVIDFKKYERIIRERWERVGEDTYRCKQHGTIFDDTGTCLKCWEECKLEKDKEDTHHHSR